HAQTSPCAVPAQLLGPLLVARVSWLVSVGGSVSCSCGPGRPPPLEAEVRKRHVVVLSEQERARLHTMIGRGVPPASALTHARILLKANQGEAGPSWTDTAIGAALEVNPATVAR